MKLLITRPRPGADATASRMEAEGHAPLVMPMFVLRAAKWEAPDPASFDALLFTSANAVRLAGDALALYAALPVYAVGNPTGIAAQSVGLDIAATGESDAPAILAQIARAGHRRILWLAGRDRITLPQVEGITIEPVIVYQSDPLPAPRDFVTLLRDADAVLLHSARTAAHFCELCDAHKIARADISIAAFSPAIAANAGEGWRSVSIAPAPNDAALFVQLASDLAGCTGKA